MEKTQIPLLSVKLKIPKPRERYIVRERLNQKLHKIKQNKVTVIKAGAGSGKTTLLSAFFYKEENSEVSWITLDETMNQPFIFWRYVLEALKGKLQSNYESLVSLFEGNMQKDMLVQDLSLLINAMEQMGEQILVLDDFWHITDEFLISTLDYLLSNLPENLHLVLITRQMPKVYLGTLSIEGSVLLIEEGEILFTREEAREFLYATLKRTYEKAKSDSMIDSCGGWVGGLQLMALGQGEKSSLFLSGSQMKRKLVDEYIGKEIYCYLKEEEKIFLKQTALLPYFNETIIRSYMPGCPFEEMMEQIVADNLFVIHVDEERKEYRYHSIMKEYLIHLYDGEEQEKYKLCNKAATIYYELGAYEECIQELFFVGSYERAMEDLLKMPQTTLTFSYVMQVPLEEIRKNVDFAYQYFFCYYASLEVEKCKKIYTFFMEHADEDMKKGFSNTNLFLNVLWNEKDIKVLSLKAIESMPLSEVSKAFLLVKEAYFLYMEERCEEAFLYLNRAEQCYASTKNVYLEMFVLAERSQLLENNGEFRKTLEVYKKMEQYLKNVPTLQCSYYIGIAGVHIKQLKIDEAREELEVVRKNLKKDLENMYQAYLYTLSQLAYVEDKWSKTEEILTAMTREDVKMPLAYMAGVLAYPEYRTKKRRSQFIKEYEAAGEKIPTMEAELMYIRLLWEDGKQQSVELLEHFLTRCRKNQNKCKLVEAGLLKAIMLKQKRESGKEIENVVLEAISYGAEEDMGVFFWMQRKELAPIWKKQTIWEKLSQKQQAFLTGVLEEQWKQEKREESTGKDILTDREKQVLEEIKKGATNKQIAEHLMISVATVKTHIINIYSKLGVSNRVEAVTIAKNES